MKYNAISLMSLGLPADIASRIGDIFGGVQSITATGTVIGDAAQVTKMVVVIGTSSASTGIKLPAVAYDADGGDEFLIKNKSGQTINIFPESASVQINAVGNGTAVTLANGKSAIAFKSAAAQWEEIGLD